MASRSVEIISSDDRAIADVDQHNEALVMQDEIHTNIHRGVMFHAGSAAEGVANDGTVEILIQVSGSTSCHAQFFAAAGGDHKVELFEDATFSAAGTSITPSNRNRFSSNTADTTLTHTPTLTADGTLLANGLRPGGSGGNAVGSAASGFAEWVLATGTVYLLRITNIAGTAQLLSIAADFYEPI